MLTELQVAKYLRDSIPLGMENELGHDKHIAVRLDVVKAALALLESKKVEISCAHEFNSGDLIAAMFRDGAGA